MFVYTNYEQYVIALSYVKFQATSIIFNRVTRKNATYENANNFYKFLANYFIFGVHQQYFVHDYCLQFVGQMVRLLICVPNYPLGV